MNKKDFIEMMHSVQAPLKGMIEMVPDDKLDWAPAKGFMNIAQLLQHLSDNWSFLKMIAENKSGDVDMKAIEESMKLENLPSCTKAEALKAIEADLNNAISYIETNINDDDFFSKEITSPWGFKGEVWKAILMLREHQVNHKMQLHLYLKMLGLPVHTGTLYGM
ncbi:MAG: DinB family protein [Candidatus Omnitrophota bacterium]